MSLSLPHITHIPSDKIGHFRFKKFDNDSYLLTNDVGKFHFLDMKNFIDFIQGNLDQIDDREELVNKGFIKNDSYQDKMIGSFLLKNNYIGLGPTLHMIITTLRCNHHCKYCHAAVAPMTATQFDMTRETAAKVVDTIFYTNSQSLTIEFQGGESLVNWDVVQYVVEISNIKALHLKKEVSYSLVTNLSLMTEEKMEWCIENKIGISTSLDGDERNHNNNRTGYDGNSFDKVTYWIKKFNTEYERRGRTTRVGALLTVTKENLEYYKDIIDTYVGLGLESIFLRWLNPYGFAASDMKTLAYTKEEWLDFYKKSMDYIIEINKSGKLFRESITSVYLMKILSQTDPNFMDIRSPSGIAIGGVAYNYDGKVYASDESRMLGRMGIDDFLMTDLKDTGEETYKAMIESDVTKIVVQSSCLDGLPGYNDHVYKPYIGVDIIHNYKTVGTLFNPLPKDEKMYLQIGILDYIFDKIKNDEQVKNILYSWVGFQK